MTDERVRELLIRFAEEAGEHSLHGPVFPMFRELWKLMYCEGGERGMWLNPGRKNGRDVQVARCGQAVGQEIVS